MFVRLWIRWLRGLALSRRTVSRQTWQLQARRSCRRPRVSLELGIDDRARSPRQQRAQSVDIKPVPRRTEWLEIRLGQREQTHRRTEAPAMFRVRRKFELLLQMHETACGLDETLEVVRVLRTRCQPEMFQNIVRFVIALFIPAPKKAAITGVLGDIATRIRRSISLELLDKSRNPLAFVHVSRNLRPSEMRGKPARAKSTAGDSSQHRRQGAE